MTVLPEFVRVLYVAVTDYTNLELRKNFKESDVVALAEHTDLVSWIMKVTKLDRLIVIVHLEQIDVRTRSSKQFSVELGKRLQKQATDSDRCIVKMSRPHIQRATGPLFSLETKSWRLCNLNRLCILNVVLE